MESSSEITREKMTGWLRHFRPYSAHRPVSATSPLRFSLRQVSTFTSWLLDSLLPWFFSLASPVAVLGTLPSNNLWLTLPVPVYWSQILYGLPLSWTLKWCSDGMLNIAGKMKYYSWSYERIETVNRKKKKEKKSLHRFWIKQLETISRVTSVYKESKPPYIN